MERICPNCIPAMGTYLPKKYNRQGFHSCLNYLAIKLLIPSGREKTPGAREINSPYYSYIESCSGLVLILAGALFYATVTFVFFLVFFL
jgi:hypothetical protein